MARSAKRSTKRPKTAAKGTSTKSGSKPEPTAKEQAEMFGKMALRNLKANVKAGVISLPVLAVIGLS